jgi:hypothetical protein
VDQDAQGAVAAIGDQRAAEVVDDRIGVMAVGAVVAVQQPF